MVVIVGINAAAFAEASSIQSEVTASLSCTSSLKWYCFSFPLHLKVTSVARQSFLTAFSMVSSWLQHSSALKELIVCCIVFIMTLDSAPIKDDVAEVKA